MVVHDQPLCVSLNKNIRRYWKEFYQVAIREFHLGGLNSYDKGHIALLPNRRFCHHHRRGLLRQTFKQVLVVGLDSARAK